MLARRTERHRVCPTFEGIAIDAESKVACDSDKERVFPILVANLPAFHYLFHTLFQPLDPQHIHPTVDDDVRDVGQHMLASRERVRPHKFVIIVHDIVRHREHELRNVDSVRICHRTIRFTHDMEHHIGIGWIVGMEMAVPV